MAWIPEWLFEVWPWILAVIDLIAASAVTIHAVLWKRDTRSVIAWVGLAWLTPLLGSTAYFAFGINRIQRRATALRMHASSHYCKTPPSRFSRNQTSDFESEFADLLSLECLGRKLTGRELLPGNRIEPLCDGDQSYPAMLQAIDEAKLSISLISYIFDNDRAGERFLQALQRATKRGVEVRVLIDHVGSRYSRPSMIQRLRRAGVRTESFLPTLIPRLFKYANLRNHRKILIVDGVIGFTGGTNIREGHWLSLKPRYPVRCLHFRVTGPVVTQMQETFAIDWAFTTGETLDGPTWFPPMQAEGDVWARGIQHGPDEDFEALSDTLLGALAVARQSVRIMSPYFLPHPALVQALNVTALRGVQVEIFLPEQSNLPLVQWAATAQYWQYLEKGCRIYLTPPPFDHTKLMVVDGLWSLIGSTNWDSRSLRLNFEFNIECYSHQLASVLHELMDAKRIGARQITLEEVDSRPFPIQLRDGLSRLLTPYL